MPPGWGARGLSPLAVSAGVIERMFYYGADARRVPGSRVRKAILSTAVCGSRTDAVIAGQTDRLVHEPGAVAVESLRIEPLVEEDGRSRPPSIGSTRNASASSANRTSWTRAPSRSVTEISVIVSAWRVQGTVPEPQRTHPQAWRLKVHRMHGTTKLPAVRPRNVRQTHDLVGSGPQRTDRRPNVRS